MAKGGSTGPGGGAQYNFPTRELAQAAAAGAADGALRILLEIQTEIRKNLSRPGTGIRYPGQPTRSSAPGRPPAAQTGSLRNSWQTGKPSKRIAGSRIAWAVGAALPYARLEFGFGRALPRPYIAPAIRIVTPRAKKIMDAYVASAIRKAFPSMKR